MNGKIGVFDSGFGGLTILRGIQDKLSDYDYVYLGDSKRAPYGEKTHEEIFNFTKEGIKFLFEKGSEIVILACNSASAEALRQIQQDYLPKSFPGKKVLGVIIPTAEEAVLKTQNKKIAVIATTATVHAGTFKKEIQKLDPEVEVFEIPAPLLVPMIEKGDFENKDSEKIIQKYVEEVLKTGADTLILGCTHYGILKEKIKKYSGSTKVLSEEEIIGNKLKDYLERHAEKENLLSKNGSLEFSTTGDEKVFNELGSRFFSKEIQSKKIVL